MAEAIAPSSWTMPSHMSLFTGQPPLVHAMETETGTLSREFPTMAEVLKQRGYRTIGVYSAPYLSPHWGFGRGFDRYQPVYGQQVARRTRSGRSSSRDRRAPRRRTGKRTTPSRRSRSR
jgi:arylsulfatase A-like enzyme